MLSAYIDTEKLKYTEDIFYGCLKFFWFSLVYPIKDYVAQKELTQVR